MNPMRFFAVFLLLAGLGLAAGGAHAELVEGRDYTVLPTPQPTEGGKGIEVIEFFWYGCPHCYALHPYIKDWLKKMPKDVNFRFVPAIFRPNWIPGAKIFYALEALGMRDKLHDKVYDAIHLEKIDLARDEILFDWIAKQGVDRQKFIDAYNSFSVQSQASRSAQMSRDYGLSGVPSLVVDGRYLTSGRMGGTPQDTIKVLDELLEKVRKEKTRK